MPTAAGAKRPTEIVVVDDGLEDVCCDGGLGSLGHPAVYIPFDSAQVVDCYYCSRRFVKKRFAERAEEAGLDLNLPLPQLFGA